jgi:hypothetical protein
VVVAALLSACGAIEQQSSLVRPAVPGRPQVAGIGDAVMDLKLVESLPNSFGKADIFGRTRDTGRVTVRFVGLDGDQAIFVRQDVTIQSNETTLTQAPLLAPAYQVSTMHGSVGWLPVSGARSRFGLTFVPPTPAYSYPIQPGQVQMAAPIGGSVLVEGRRIRILRSVEGGIEYQVE